MTTTYTQTYVAGSASSYTNYFNSGADLNSVTSAQWVISSDSAIANGTNLDLYMQCSFLLGSISTGSGTPFVALYLLPVNEDGTHYANEATSGATTPVSTYLAATCLVTVSNGGAVVYGTFPPFPIPPTSFKLGFHNKTGANLASSGNAFKYYTFNEKTVG